MKQQKYPLLATLFYQYGLEGYLFFSKIGSKFYCIEFMSALIIRFIPAPLYSQHTKKIKRNLFSELFTLYYGFLHSIVTPSQSYNFAFGIAPYLHTFESSCVKLKKPCKVKKWCSWIFVNVVPLVR